MRRHELDPVSLVFGLLFLAVAVVFLVDAPALAVLRLRWILPTLGIVVGLALLTSALRPDTAVPSATQAPPPPSPSPDDDAESPPAD